MNRKEKIIEILNTYQSIIPPLHDEGMVDPMDFHKVADAIMALPIDVPSEEEIENEFWEPTQEKDEDGEFIWKYAFDDDQVAAAITGAKWMQKQIIERNN